MEFCVKEENDLPKDKCGQTAYFGDKWDLHVSKCVYRKCSDVCEEGELKFSHDDEEYTRTTYCCKNQDYCNGMYDGAIVSIVVAEDAVVECDESE